jgi:sugar O-acyltransferase (sialic acid O-acetyltransferase NeuD family)
MITILGAGGFAKEVLALLKFNNSSIFEYRMVVEPFGNYMTDRFYYMGVGDPYLRYKFYNHFRAKHSNFNPLISNDLICDDETVSFGEGTIVCQNCVITTDVQVGKFSIINISSTVGHDARIGDFVTIAPACNILGFAEVGDFTELGANVTVLPKVRIGKHCMIGAGTLVTKDVPDYSLVYGVPGKVIKEYRKDKRYESTN